MFVNAYAISTQISCAGSYHETRLNIIQYHSAFVTTFACSCLFEASAKQCGLSLKQSDLLPNFRADLYGNDQQTTLAKDSSAKCKCIKKN